MTEQTDILDTIVGQVQHAVRQIDAALADTRLNDMGRLYLRKVRGTLLATEDVGDIWPEGQWEAACHRVLLPNVSDQLWCQTHIRFEPDPEKP